MTFGAAQTRRWSEVEKSPQWLSGRETLSSGDKKAALAAWSLPLFMSSASTSCFVTAGSALSSPESKVPARSGGGGLVLPLGLRSLISPPKRETVADPLGGVGWGGTWWAASLSTGISEGRTVGSGRDTRGQEMIWVFSPQWCSAETMCDDSPHVLQCCSLAD